MIKEFLDEFETALKRLNDKGINYGDIRFYNLIEEIIKVAKGKFSLAD